MTAPDAMTSRTRAFLARPCGGCAGLSADAMLAGYRNVGIARGSDRVDGLVELPGILGTDPGGVAPGCRGVVGLLDGLDRTRGGMFHRELSHPAEGSATARCRMRPTPRSWLIIFAFAAIETPELVPVRAKAVSIVSSRGS